MTDDPTQAAGTFVLQIGIILVAAKIGAEIFERWLHQPSVLGELVAGVVIGPYALGSVSLPWIGPIFEPATAQSAIPVSPFIWVLAELGAIVLLFVAGLDTDFGSFVRFGPQGAVVALGGVILPFVLGDLVTTVALSVGPLTPAPLFMGATLTATSVGLTARVLGDIGKIDTPEGVTIMSAAVFDDVIGILSLAVVIAMVGGNGTSPLDLAVVAGRALLGWAALTLILVLAAHRLAAIILYFKTAGALVALALAAALLSAYVAQSVGLAMIIGAYSSGIALSRSELRSDLQRTMRNLYHAIVPTFFVVTGMLVNVSMMSSVAVLGTSLTLVAVLGKLVGCGLPALATGFTRTGALRIGVGMIPRGEVAFIIAGAGLAAGAISSSMYAAAIFVACATTLVTPPLLAPLFMRSAGGLRDRRLVPSEGELRQTIELPEDVLYHFERHLVQKLQAAGFDAVSEVADPNGNIRYLKRDEQLLTLQSAGAALHAESERPVGDWQTIIGQAAASATAEVAELLGGVAEGRRNA